MRAASTIGGQQFRAGHAAHHPGPVHQQHAFLDRPRQPPQRRDQRQAEAPGIQSAERLDTFQHPDLALPAAQTHGAGHAEQGRAGIGAEAAAGAPGARERRRQSIDQRGLADARRTDQQHAPVAAEHGLDQRRRLRGQLR